MDAKFRIISLLIMGLLASGFTSCVSTTTGPNAGYVDKSAESGNEIVSLAKDHMGTPYRYGGSDPEGFDCSGLTQYVYSQAGYDIPRNTQAQYTNMIPVQVPRVGDLVFFITEGNSISHVGIYSGNYKFIHSPSSGKTVSIADIRMEYWRTRYAGSRTIF